MIASTNLPGSRHFSYFRGTKKEYEKWLAQRAEELKESCGGLWYNAYSPAEIVPEKKARTWRYRDGTRVCRCFD